MVRATSLEGDLLREHLEVFTAAASMIGHPQPPEEMRDASPHGLVMRAYRAESWCVLIRLDPLPATEIDRLVDPLTVELSTAQWDKDKGAEKALLYELLDLWMKRIQAAKSEGLWKSTMQILAGDQALANEIAAAYVSVLGVSPLFPLRIGEAVEGVADWMEKGGFGPHKTWPRREGLLTSEVSYLCELPHEEYEGHLLLPECRFGVAPTPTAEEEKRKEYRFVLGEVLDRHASTGRSLEIDVDQLARHALITGLTGSGKTTTCRRLIESMRRSAGPVPFLVIEPAKDEYSSWFRTLRKGTYNVFSIDDEDPRVQPLWINPFVPSVGFSIQSHIDFLCQLFQAAFNFWGPQVHIVVKSIYRAYKNAGWNLDTGRFQWVRPPRKLAPPQPSSAKIATVGTPSETAGPATPDPEPPLAIEGVIHYPRFGDFIAAVQEVTREDYKGEFAQNLEGAILGRLQRLQGSGAKEQIYSPDVSIPEEELFEKPCLVKLAKVSDDEKAFLIGLIFTRLYEYHEVNSQGQTGLKHICLIEEAHRLFRRTSGGISGEEGSPRALSIELFSNLLAEIRAYGEGILLAEQIPQKLVSDAIKNTNLKIAHRLVHREDRELLGHAMNLSPEQVQELTLLEEGQAIVHFQGLTSAVHLKIDKEPLPWPSNVRPPEKKEPRVEAWCRILQFHCRRSSRPRANPGPRAAAADFWAWLRRADPIGPEEFRAKVAVVCDSSADQLLHLQELWWAIAESSTPATPAQRQLADDTCSAVIHTIFALSSQRFKSPTPLPSAETLRDLRLLIAEQESRAS
jgi:Helicase HerA, central domain